MNAATCCTHRMFRLALPLVLGAVASAPVAAAEPANPRLNATARKTLDYLASIYGKKMLAGYNVYVHTPDDYEQTGKHAAVWGRDIRWLSDEPGRVAQHAARHGYILTLHWHWFFDGDSAWQGKRKKKVDVGRLVAPRTPAHKQCMKELARAADTLQVFEDADVPVLWRPLHEIDGGWFWWTDKETPSNTARLWRMMFDYFTRERKLDHLIWVYSAGVGKKKTAEDRKGFYPGAKYVDISGIDIYGVDVRTDVEPYRDYYDVMAKVSPGKMLAMGEGDAIPDPDKTAAGTLPAWLYAMPWWGAPSHRRPADWAVHTMRHAFVVTLDELPPLGPGPIAPHVGILEPRDDGSAWFPDTPPTIRAYAVDRDGKVRRVTFLADGKPIGTAEAAPYTFTWTNAPAGCYDLTARAEDDAGMETASNTIRAVVGMVDAARGKPVVASPGETPEAAVDGDYYTAWSAAKTDKAWLYVDLGAVRNIDRVNLLWGWKIHPSAFTVDVARAEPRKPAGWTSVHTATDRPYVTWEATDRLRFDPVAARYVRVSATKRAGNQTWSGYKLMALEVPVKAP
ncbi:MAG: glycosyl hydrolase [Phycisphaerae bacterium]